MTPRAPLDEDLAASIARLGRSGLERHPVPLERRADGTVLLGGRTLVDFSSNDYLGLAADSRLGEAAADAAREHGTGAGAARLISGNHPLHESLEDALAAFKRADAALLFSSGFMANVGAIPALTRRGDVIYSDELNHASVVDACRLSRAGVRIFPHRDLDALDRMLERDHSPEGRRWIVVDAVFSMDGDLFPLDRLADLAERHGARTYVDDAHGTGVLGTGGRGSAEHWDVEGRIDVVMGTLGKALGTAGAFVTGSERLRRWLLNRARSFVFTTGSPPALAAAAIEALRIVRAEPERRDRLWRNVERLRTGLSDVSGGSAPHGPGHILPVRIGDAGETVRIGEELRRRGFLVGAIRPPSVPEGGSRLRISASASHTAAQIDGLLQSLDAVLASGTARSDR